MVGGGGLLGPQEEGDGSDADLAGGFPVNLNCICFFSNVLTNCVFIQVLRYTKINTTAIKYVKKCINDKC